MKCKKCGYLNNDSSKYCVECGSKLSNNDTIFYILPLLVSYILILPLFFFFSYSIIIVIFGVLILGDIIGIILNCFILEKIKAIYIIYLVKLIIDGSLIISVILAPVLFNNILEFIYDITVGNFVEELGGTGFVLLQ